MSESVPPLPTSPDGPAPLMPGVAQPAATYIDSWLHRLPWAVVVVDDNLNCVWANAAAQGLAEQGKITLAEGRLAVGDATATESLRAFVREIDSHPETWVTKTNQGDHLVVRGDLVEPTSFPAAVALVIKSTSDTLRHSLWADLRRAFGLTRSEALVITRMADGDSADDIAIGLGLAIETVRSHIRRAYTKLGVGSREQLFAKVLPFRIG